MKIDKITMKENEYFRVIVDEPPVEWMDKLIELTDFKSYDKLQEYYCGRFEIEGYFDGNKITDNAVVYYMDDYERILELSRNSKEISDVESFLREHFENLPDNSEYNLGDCEWEELAYGSKKLKELWTVISYWVGESDTTNVWIYDTYKEAKEGMQKLWQQSYELAKEDDDFDEEKSHNDGDFAEVCWSDGLIRYFEVQKSNRTETL